MIEIKNLSKRYGDIEALSNVSFSVPKGQIVGFLGANGAGKTTTMDILCGCIGADSGSASIGGTDVTERPEEAKKKLGYLPDEPPLYNDMRVQDFVTYAARLRKVPSSEVGSRVDSVIDRLSLGDVRKRLVGNLSKGYRQRVGLAQAIVHNPDVLVLDEPTEGLDPNQIVQIRDLIKGLAGEHTILLSSHILSEVQNTCDHIVIIHQGKIVQTGTYDEIVRGGDLATYQYRVSVAKDVEGLAQKLRVMTGLKNIELSKSVGAIEFQADKALDSVDDIARAVLDGRHGLKEIVAVRKSLEEVFVKLTH